MTLHKGLAMQSIYDFDVLDSKQQPVSLSQYKGKVLLIVNVASRCGFTNQYTELQDIYKKYQDKGLVILAFPCNQFGAQESGSNEEISEFCSVNFNITFPIFDKVIVNGQGELPLFKYLKDQLPGVFGTKAIKWNFTKFLIDRNGKPVKRYSSTIKPMSILSDIQKLL